MNTLNEIVANLSAPLDPAMIRNRYGWKGRDGNPVYVDYVEWQDVVSLLDAHAPGWGFQTTSVVPVHNGVAVTGDLTIPSVDEDGHLAITIRSGTGYGSIEDNDRNGERAVKKAASDALKRAAVLFGVAKQLYEKSDADRAAAAPRPQGSSSYTSSGNGGGNFDPSKMVGGITGPQLNALKTKFQGADAVAATMFNVSTLQELTKGQASQLMDALKGATAATAGGPNF